MIEKINMSTQQVPCSLFYACQNVVRISEDVNTVLSRIRVTSTMSTQIIPITILILHNNQGHVYVLSYLEST